MTSFLDQESMNVDKLTQEIFSLLENKFLFGSHDSKHVLTGKPEIPDKCFIKSLSKEDIGKVRILSIDGSGSTDGILAAKSLVHLESDLCRISGKSDARIADFFDVGTGSGIGGILAALIFTTGEDGRPMLRASEALQFIVKNRSKLVPSSSKRGLFRKMFHYSKKEKIFRKLFGESTLKDTLKPVLIPCYDLSTRAPFLFSRSDAMECDSYDFKMTDVCAATSADPSVGTFMISSVDRTTRIVAVNGSVAMNNPTAAAITHVLNNKHEFPFCDSVEDLLVVSLGNGVSNFGSPRNYIKIGAQASSDIVDESVSMAFGSFKDSNYVRIQENGFSISRSKNILDIAEQMLAEKNVATIPFRGKMIAEKTNSDKLKSFAEVLVKEHQRRKMSILPTVILKNSMSPRSSSATVSTESSF